MKAEAVFDVAIKDHENFLDIWGYPPKNCCLNPKTKAKLEAAGFINRDKILGSDLILANNLPDNALIFEGEK